jgi:hypothetical protein
MTYSLAGLNDSYADRWQSAVDRAQRLTGSMFQGLPENQRYVAPLATVGLARDFLASDPRTLMETLEATEPFYQRRAEKQQQLAMQSNLFASFLKDVPAAISNAFAQRQRYAPEAIQIAANAANRAGSGYGMPNYYGFVG